jgi:hypothetical protein
MHPSMNSKKRPALKRRERGIPIQIPPGESHYMLTASISREPVANDAGENRTLLPVLTLQGRRARKNEKPARKDPDGLPCSKNCLVGTTTTAMRPTATAV